MSDSQLSEPRIVCAANRLTYTNRCGIIEQTVIPSARHMDKLMHVIRRQLLTYLQDGRFNEGTPGEGSGMPDNRISEEQGFIDQHGHFYTREEAWIIAVRNNQITRRGGWPEGRLYSENLY